MRKIYTVLTTIILIAFLSLSLVVSKQIGKEFTIRRKNINDLNYIKTLDDKIDILNNMYTNSSNTNDINNKLELINKNIELEKKEIETVKTKNDELKTIIDEYKR